MNKTQKIIVTFAILMLLFGALGAAFAPGGARAANVQSQLLALAQVNPTQQVAVIAQKADTSDRAEKLVARLGGTITKDLHIINAFAAKLSAGSAVKLAQSTTVRWVSLDGPVESTGKPAPPPTTPTLPANVYNQTLNLQAVWDMGYTGAGIGVAVIDSGISPDGDFARLRRSVSFNPSSTNVTDFNGHGSHVAGIIAGNGSTSSGFYKGVAPDADLISLKISDDTGMAYESDAVAAMQWVMTNGPSYNIRVVNLSIQSTAMGSYHQSPMNAAAEILWFNGYVVVAASGNYFDGGSYNPVWAAPANDPFLITVGATDEKGTAATRDDVIASFTAVDETLDFHLKPELYAPGKNIYSVLSFHSPWGTQYPDRAVFISGKPEYFRLSGTSMATPMVSGAAALLLQAQPNLTPDQVKYRLINASGSVSKRPYLDVYKAITTPTTASANTGLQASQLLWTGTNPITWDSVAWNSVAWNSVAWNSVAWNSVAWNSVAWNAVAWNQ